MNSRKRALVAIPASRCTDNQAQLLPRIRAERAARAAARSNPGEQLQETFDGEAAHLTVRRLRPAQRPPRPGSFGLGLIAAGPAAAALWLLLASWLAA